MLHTVFNWKDYNTKTNSFAASHSHLGAGHIFIFYYQSIKMYAHDCVCVSFSCNTTISKSELDLNLFIIHFSLQLLVVSDFSHGLHEIFIHNIFPITSDSKHPLKKERDEGRAAWSCQVRGKKRLHGNPSIHTPASVQTFRRSAPLKSSDNFTTAS